MENSSPTLPLPFISRMHSLLKEDAPDFFKSLELESPVSIRLNPLKFREHPNLEKIPWCETGFYLPQRPSFTLDPLFHAGAYYVQEPSSMFLEQVFRQVTNPDEPILILDLCGAPGGKSTHLLSLMNDDSLLITNEVIRSRASILSENVRKWGNSNVVVTSNDPRDFAALGGIFDLVVVDAPCSGEGLFRKDRNSISEWSVENAALCSSRQKRILSDAWECIKPGGFLVYSTCTFNPEENELNLAWLLEKDNARPVLVPVSQFDGVWTLVSGEASGYSFFPHRIRGEGFFTGVVQKTKGKEYILPRIRKSRLQQLSKDLKKQTEDWLIRLPDQVLLQDKNQIFAFRESWLNYLNFFSSRLRIIDLGCPVAEIAGKGLNPLHGLALSPEINREYFPSVDFSIEQAISYLKRETFPADFTSAGWVLVTYKGVPVGWLKNLGIRFNNYYPAPWRIRMAVDKVPVPWHESI